MVYLALREPLAGGEITVCLRGFTGESSVSGRWEATFPVDFAALAASQRSLERPVEINGWTAVEVTLSPLSLRMELHTEEEGAVFDPDSPHDFGGTVGTYLFFVMEDGTRFHQPLSVSGYEGQTAYLRSNFDRVIDPQQVREITLGTGLTGDPGVPILSR